MKGRKPKPTALKLLAGNPGKRPLPENEPQPAAPIGPRAPYAPRFLDEEGQKEWRRIVTCLIDAGLYTEVDRAALAMYCTAWSRWLAAERKIDEGEAVHITDKNYHHQSPWVSIANQRWSQLKAIMAEFGMTPSSRSRVTAVKPEEKDELQQLLERRAAGGRR